MARREAAAAGPGSRALVVDLIRSAGPISRVELVEQTGLTQPTISNIVRRLIADGVVRETGETVATGGKPRALLVINSQALFGVGMHLGPDTITAVATNARGGTVGHELVARPADHDPSVLADTLIGLYRSLTQGLDLDPHTIAGLTVVGPGPVDVARGRLLGPGEHGEQAGFDLGAALSRALAIPALVDNDATAAAIGEFWGRQVSRDRTFGCLYLGAGIGSGVVLDGALHRGASSNSGEIGHNTVVRDGAPCVCGNRGCLERYASPSVLVDRARATPGLAERLEIAAEDGYGHAFDTLARAAVYGDADASALIEESARWLADAAVTLANLWDLDTLVLAGPGFAVAGSIYVREIRERLADRAFARRLHPVAVDLSSNPRDSAAIGGAALILQGSVAPGHGPQVAMRA
ncbi:ROK family transcriptional regulator [Xylanimonas allomyrinae]|uniref:ROK family transcriptional regulator n=1 Tax=Xylanimonas allomyrinae TaxID=2509459 RepID=UPI001B874AD6|nr:ROK family transcriptional regulator [Xylanimonas allomyrinae]